LGEQDMTTDPYSGKKPTGDVQITKQNLADYGFACFHQQGACQIRNGFWTRKISLNGEQKSIFQNFKVPEAFCIELSSGEKLTTSDYFEIQASKAPIQAMALLAQRAGWNQTIPDLEAMIRVASDGVFIASYRFNNQEIPLGSGVSLTVNEDYCWIGMILVHPELRRQGIARAIMNACLQHARMIQKKSVIGLDATPLGKQVYDSLGFKDSFTIWRSVIPTHIQPPDMPGFDGESFDIKLVINYLESKNYIERLQIIGLLSNIPDSKNISFITSDGVKGFVMSRPGRLKPFIGPLIADSADVALILLKMILNYWKDLGHENVFMDIPELHLHNSVFHINEHEAMADKLDIPAKPVRSFIRMYHLVNTDDLKASSGIGNFKLSINQSTFRKSQSSYDITTAFMQKEKLEIVPIMFGTSGPEWS
jgi:GNAT superfamily N-acetyltransferase